MCELGVICVCLCVLGSGDELSECVSESGWLFETFGGKEGSEQRRSALGSV